MCVWSHGASGETFGAGCHTRILKGEQFSLYIGYLLTLARQQACNLVVHTYISAKLYYCSDSQSIVKRRTRMNLEGEEGIYWIRTNGRFTRP